MSRRLALLGIVVLLAVALAATGCTTKVYTSGTAQPTVTATGNGETFAPPDVAEMNFGVQAINANAKTALAQASARAAKITAALKKAGISADDIQTQNVSVSPNYANTPGKPVITGYTASISVNAKVRDLGTLGDVITAANAAGATNVDGPTFTISDDSLYRAQSINKAVDDARKQADQMARAAGKTLGDVISITNTTVSTPPIAFSGAQNFATAAPAVPISPGQLTVSASVTVVFALK